MSSQKTMINPAYEAQYALRKRHPERDLVYQDHKLRSERFREHSRSQLDIRYGQNPRCLLDYFPASKTAPLFFFIHGGYWRALNKELVSFIAEPFQRAGISVVIPGYTLVPETTVAGILSEIRAAFSWVRQNIAPEKVVVGGHSAGGQLAAMLALDQIETGSGPIIGLAGLSGVYDLRPLLDTSINSDLNLTAKTAADASPCLRLEKMGGNAGLIEFLSIVGGRETEGFKEWSKDMSRVWRDCGGRSVVVEEPNSTHFTLLDSIADPSSDVNRMVLEMCY